ncbi:hypothetical protein BGZ80_001789 [Entomortierella chlamydospora]|uniref:PNPLA domain-containing protein n=1 Tax=Entomortierella chlamydospora TaxID=101097 RepID=A0A9P6MQB8_9FUNG|nr:hypothetical protein BGZ80_001789 [Entomortierella chlamydospora]
MVASDISTKSKFNHHHGVRLLSLDGGGVRGIVSLMVLDELMKRIQKRKGLSETPLPADYFELAAGTSTGGIIAIMLFRLRMSAEQAIEEYKIISQEVFKPKVYGFRVPGIFEGLVNKTKTIFQDSRFDSATLEKAIDSVVEKYGLDENDKKEKGKALLSHPKSSKMEETVLLRSYSIVDNSPSSIVNDCMRKGKDQISINLAVKATSAAPTYFPEVVWKPHGSDNSLVFWDGGLLNNNPIDQLWYARHDVVEHDEPEPPISCVISLGTGYSRPGDPSSSWFRLTGVLSSVMALATNTNAKAKDFSRHMSDLKKRPAYKNTIYYRLNPHLKGNQIDLADYTKMDLLIELTNRYLQEKESAKYLELTVDAICPN